MTRGFHHLNGSGMNGMSSSLKCFFIHKDRSLSTASQHPASHFDTWAKDPFRYLSHSNFCVELTLHFVKYFHLKVCRLFLGERDRQKAVDLTVQFRPTILAGSIRERKQNTWRPAGVDGSFVGCVRWAIRHLSIEQRWQSSQNDKISQRPMTLTDQSDRHLLTQTEQHKRNHVCASCHRRIH